MEVQPCFNRDVISELSDQASTSLLDCAAWSEGEGTQYSTADIATSATPHLEQVEADGDLSDALYRGDLGALRDLIKHFDSSTSAKDRITRVFLTALSQAPEESLVLLLDTGLIDLQYQDEINERNCLHKTAMAGRRSLLQIALRAGVDASMQDAYGRIPLHYAAMYGHNELIDDLVSTDRSTVNTPDLDDFTPLIHAINHGKFTCVEKLLFYSAYVNPVKDDSHIPLNLACQYGSVPVVELLLRYKPTIMPDAEGLYPQHLVARFGTDARLLLLLREYGADLDQTDKLYQWTPLFHAASEGRVGCMQTLIDCGVRTDVVDEKGQSALYYATWEGHIPCMVMLASFSSILPSKPTTTGNQDIYEAGARPLATTGTSVEHIPDLSLPPPIIPTRRYGHNFLDTKTTVMIIFGEGGRNAVTFFDDSKYPAARLTVAPRSSDLLARNLLLPVQEDSRCVSFETDDLSTFAIDFDIFPTFGKKVIAKGSVPSEVFRSSASSSGYHHLSLLDPRLRAVGQMYFKFQVIKPFQGLSLDITAFATYWKATSQLEARPSSFVTGSSLSGRYVHLCVQMTQDLVPVVCPEWNVELHGLSLPVLRLTHTQFTALKFSAKQPQDTQQLQEALRNYDMAAVHDWLSKSYLSLADVLVELPSEIQVIFHVLYPSEEQEETLHLGPTPNINNYVDKLLGVVFEHARNLRAQPGSPARSMAFSSSHGELCTALNWKQPNCKSIPLIPRSNII